MICDVNAHYILQAFSDFMGDRVSPPVGVSAPTGIASHPVSVSQADIQGRLELMDAAGRSQCRSCPHRPPYLPDEAEGAGQSTPSRDRRGAILFAIRGQTGVSHGASEVDPVSWTPDRLRSRSPRWPRQDCPMHLSSAAKW